MLFLQRDCNTNIFCSTQKRHPKRRPIFFQQMDRLPCPTFEHNRLLLPKRELILYKEGKSTWVPLETGCKIAPAPTTFALALAIDGRREPSAEAER